MANALTSIRIICGLLIAALPAFSSWFYVCYLVGGFTDAVDGAVARKLGKATAFGARLDTVADMVFVLAVTIKILCNFAVPLWTLVWIAGIALMRTAGALIGCLKHGHLIAVHSVSNKLAGLVVFIVPLVIGSGCAWQVKLASITCACAFATVSAVREIFFVWNGKGLE